MRIAYLSRLQELPLEETKPLQRAAQSHLCVDPSQSSVASDCPKVHRLRNRRFVTLIQPTRSLLSNDTPNGVPLPECPDSEGVRGIGEGSRLAVALGGRNIVFSWSTNEEDRDRPFPRLSAAFGDGDRFDFFEDRLKRLIVLRGTTSVKCGKGLRRRGRPSREALPLA